MNMINFDLHFDLLEPHLRQVVDGARRLLSEIGIRCASPGAKRLMSALPGCRANADRVTFSSELVDEQLSLIRQINQPSPPQAHITQGPCWTCLNIARRQGRPRETRHSPRPRPAVRLLRPWASAEAAPRSWSLRHRSRSRIFSPARPASSTARPLGMPTGMPDEVQLPLFKDLFQAAGRGPVHILAMMIVSPLRYDDTVLDYCMAHGQDPSLSLHPTAGMPCVGSTSPVQFPAALILTLSEALAASFFVRAWRGHIWLPSLRSDPFDFRYGNYVVGSSPYGLLDAATRRLFEHLTGYPSQGGALLSLARWPDAHAIHDHVLSATLQALQGARHFSGSGQLSHDEVFSPEIVVIDRDILRSVECLIQGLQWDGDLDRSLATLQEGAASGQFLDHHATLDNFRRLVVDQSLFLGMNLGQQRTTGAQPLIEEARGLVDQLVSQSPFRLAEDLVKELDGIYRRALHVAHRP